MTPTKRVAVLGASGYAGQEVLRLLRSHGQVQVALATTARIDHEPPPPPLPYDAVTTPLDLDQLQRVDGVFVCAPHGAAAALAAAALDRDCAVVDLSADFRLQDPATYEATYGVPHPAPARLEQAVYGLTEQHRDRIAQTKLVANPGCYPTSILLPLLPLLDAELLDDQAPIIADAKSGVSGAGKTPSERTVYGNVHDNCVAYGIGNHRHGAEIAEQTRTDRVVFVPHLLPTFRGILTTLYLRIRAGRTAGDVRACLDEVYGNEPFVRIYGHGLPELNRVQQTNYCDIAIAPAGDLVVVVSALDNLVKGAAGQAVQNMNLMLGLPEGAGLS